MWNWVLSGGRKSFEMHNRKSFALKGMLVEMWILKENLLKAQKEKKKAVDKASVF